MIEFIKSQGKSFVQGLLAGKVPVETYVPIVTLMVGYFFHAAVSSAGG